MALSHSRVRWSPFVCGGRGGGRDIEGMAGNGMAGSVCVGRAGSAQGRDVEWLEAQEGHGNCSGKS